jgi:GTP-binding protein Era
MPFRAGVAAMLGKPNVGKSTIVNALVGQKVSIVSSKPQTTRRRVLGIVQSENYQVALIDTPGIHEPHTTLGKAMVDSAKQALAGIDAVLYVADVSKRADAADRHIAKLVRPDGKPVAPIILCLNKMDLLPAEMVVPHVESYTKLFDTEEYMLTSATKRHNLDKLMELLISKMPEGEPLFPNDEYTDQSMRFLASEIVREQVLKHTREEVPHATAVVIDEWIEEEALVRITASIVVEKQGQKAILIGKGGQFVKKVGTAARLEIQKLIDRPVYLELFVKVRDDWRMNPRMLQELEFAE